MVRVGLFLTASSVLASSDEACVDQDDKWAAHNTSCEKMKGLCADEKHGGLVRRWCARTCGQCPPAATSFIQFARSTTSPRSPSTEGRNASRGLGANVTINVSSAEPAVVRELEEGDNASYAEYTIVPANDWLLPVKVQHRQLPRSPAKPSAASAVKVNDTNTTTGAVSVTIAAHEVEESKSCPAGFRRVPGDVWGWDQWGGGYNHMAESLEDCGKKCLRTVGCASFEYSPEERRCFRNAQTIPTRDHDHPGFTFCQRTPCPEFKHADTCPGPHLAYGALSEEVNLQGGSYCLWTNGACQSALACTETDCFMPDGGLPGMKLPQGFVLWITTGGLAATMR